MEPQIIDYYNEIPSGINVINKMNEELDELQKKYNELEKKYNKLKNPNPQILFNSIEEFNQKHEEMYNEIQKTCDFYFDDFEEILNFCGRKLTLFWTCLVILHAKTKKNKE